MITVVTMLIEILSSNQLRNARRLRESELEHQQLQTAQERQLQLELQTPRRSRDLEQQVCSIAHEREVALRELRKQAEAQPDMLKSQWKHQMSQQASYKAEIRELYAEMLNMRDKSEMQAALSAKLCRLEPPSLTVDAQSEHVLNTACPGRSPSRILASELMTHARPTTGGIQTPSGPLDVAYGASPLTQQHGRQRDFHLRNGVIENKQKKESMTCFGGPTPIGEETMTENHCNRMSCRQQDLPNSPNRQSLPVQASSGA